MRRRVLRIPILVMIAALLLAGVVSSSAQTPEGDPNNAATWYRAAYAEYKSVKFEMDVYEHSAAFEADPDRGPDATARKYVRQYREAINLTKRATRREFCDFGPHHWFDDETQGFDVWQVRPLLMRIRDEFLIRVFDGDVAGAIDNLTHSIRIARHVATQRSGNAALIGAAFLKYTDNLITFATDRAIVGPGEASRLLRELNELKGDDPFGIIETAAAERVTMIQSIRQRYLGDQGLERFREYVLPIYRERKDEAALKAISELTREDLISIIDQLDVLLANNVAAMRAGELAVLKRQAEEIEQGKHGHFARFFVGDGAHFFGQIEGTRKLLDDRRKHLQGIIDGTIDPMSLANAACWYIRAGVKLQQVDAAALALIDDHASKRDPKVAVTDELIEALNRDHVREVLRMFDTAAKIEKCDFSYAKPYWTVMYRPYHADLLACGRLLIADAMRLARDGKIDGATARLAQVYQLAARLTIDGVVASSLSAHRMFNDAEAVAIALQDANKLNEAHVETLRQAVAKFSRGDPFHYEPALASIRSTLAYWFSWFLAGAPEPVQPKIDEVLMDDAKTLLATIDADRLLALEAICEEWQMHRVPPNNPVRSPIDGLWPIFDVAEFEKCREMIQTLKQWVQQGLTQQLGQAELPVIAPLEARMRQSIEDYRACVRRLGVQQAVDDVVK